jgi:bromodomain adjacent to zinc finger domain protein 1A
MIVEFLNCFGELFDIHIDFPNGFNIEQLENAIFSKSCHSALCNLLLFYLDWIFKCYDEEKFDDLNGNSGGCGSDDEDSNDYLINGDSGDDEDNNMLRIIDKLYKEPLNIIDRDNFVKLAEKYTKLIRNTQGRSLKTIGLDVYTISEMLRLYFLTSGSLNNQKIKFWYQQRGGYTNLDDIGIDFAIYENDIVKKLENVNVFELEPGIFLSLSFSLSLLISLINYFLKMKN